MAKLGTESKTKHSTDCGRVFGRYDLSCQRCLELANGAVARPAWFKTRPVSQDRPSDWYCFCPSTSLAADRCHKCGKPPYTD